MNHLSYTPSIGWAFKRAAGADAYDEFKAWWAPNYAKCAQWTPARWQQDRREWDSWQKDKGVGYTFLRKCAQKALGPAFNAEIFSHAECHRHMAMWEIDATVAGKTDVVCKTRLEPCDFEPSMVFAQTIDGDTEMNTGCLTVPNPQI